MAWRLIKWAARLVFALIVVATLAGAYLFYRAMPTYSGAEKLPGLSAEVRVWRDAYGVPHIFAASMDDAARALGYLHASERLFQMEIQRRVGQGRMAEIQGADLLGVDKFIRTLGFYREAESSFSVAIALGAEAAHGLCRRSQRLPRKPQGRAAARVPARRRPAPSPGSLPTRWSGASFCRSSSPITTSSRRCALIFRQKLGADAGGLALSRHEAGRADHHEAGHRR